MDPGWLFYLWTGGPHCKRMSPKKREPFKLPRAGTVGEFEGGFVEFSRPNLGNSRRKGERKLQELSFARVTIRMQIMMDKGRARSHGSRSKFYRYWSEYQGSERTTQSWKRNRIRGRTSSVLGSVMISAILAEQSLVLA